jgi:hypothetical protein
MQKRFKPDLYRRAILFKRGVSKEGRIERGIKLALIPNDSPIFGGRRFLRGFAEEAS